MGNKFMKLPEWWKSNTPYKIMDCVEGMKSIPDGVVDFIITDPPYGLGGGYVCRSGKGKVFDEKWDGFEDMKNITKDWLIEAKRVLKDEGTIMVSGTHHNYPYIGYYMKELGFYIINDIVWVKPNPPPTLQHNKFCQSTEIILWARKGDRHYFNYEYARSKQKNEKQAKNVVEYSVADEGRRLHPTQKPSSLWKHLIKVATKEKAIVLDPFLGSGTTIKVCNKIMRIGLGFEIEPDYEKMIIDRDEYLKGGFMPPISTIDSIWEDRWGE